MRYAIFGGTFDPIHNGHMALAEAAIEQLELDQVILVPAFQNPLRRRAYADAADRLEMCKRALLGHPKVTVSDIEISRGGRSFTVETVEEFGMAQAGHAWLILGTDALAHFVDWRQPLKICKMARLAVIERPDKTYDAVKARLPEEVRDAIDLIKMPPNRASSTKIRDLLHAEEPADMWLHPKVWEYIVERGLYQTK